MPALPASATPGWNDADGEEVIMAHAAGRTSSRNGEGRNRTGDTTVFSRVLYQLSYLARAARSLARRDRCFGRSESFHQDIDELRLHQDGVCTRLRHCLV